MVRGRGPLWPRSFGRSCFLQTTLHRLCRGPRNGRKHSRIPEDLPFRSAHENLRSSAEVYSFKMRNSRGVTSACLDAQRATRRKTVREDNIFANLALLPFIFFADLALYFCRYSYFLSHKKLHTIHNRASADLARQEIGLNVAFF